MCDFTLVLVVVLLLPQIKFQTMPLTCWHILGVGLQQATKYQTKAKII